MDSQHTRKGKVKNQKKSKPNGVYSKKFVRLKKTKAYYGESNRKFKTKSKEKNK